jgi:protein-S-isoprenylcysteine O-methyltransferase Ste14
MTYKIASITGFVLGTLAIGVLILQHSLLADNWAGLAVQVCAFAFMIWARITFGRRSFHAAANPTAGGLVITGPYRYLRHPIYAAVLWFVWAGILSHLSSLTFALGMLLSAGLAVRMFCEESFLSKTYPEYADYAARTRRLIPFLL